MKFLRTISYHDAALNRTYTDLNSCLSHRGGGRGQLHFQGTFEPDELGALKSVFDELTSQPWFDASEEARESFAKYLFETFPAVTFDPVKHRSIIEATTRMFYTRDSA